MKHVGKFILRAAKDKGMSLRALARESGVSNCYLSQVTGGYFMLTPEILLKLAPPLGVTPEKMFEEAGWLKRKSTKGGQAKKK